MARTTIPSGTVISVTNDRYMSYSNSSANFTPHSSSNGPQKIKITLTEALMAGQILKFSAMHLRLGQRTETQWRLESLI